MIVMQSNKGDSESWNSDIGPKLGKYLTGHPELWRKRETDIKNYGFICNVLVRGVRRVKNKRNFEWNWITVRDRVRLELKPDLVLDQS